MLRWTLIPLKFNENRARSTSAAFNNVNSKAMEMFYEFIVRQTVHDKRLKEDAVTSPEVETMLPILRPPSERINNISSI
jgi:hypothetical protein